MPANLGVHDTLGCRARVLVVAGALLTDPITASVLATHSLATHAVTGFAARAAVVGVGERVDFTTVVVFLVAILEIE